MDSKCIFNICVEPTMFPIGVYLPRSRIDIVIDSDILRKYLEKIGGYFNIPEPTVNEEVLLNSLAHAFYAYAVARTCLELAKRGMCEDMRSLLTEFFDEMFQVAEDMLGKVLANERVLIEEKIDNLYKICTEMKSAQDEEAKLQKFVRAYNALFETLMSIGFKLLNMYTQKLDT